MRKADIGTSTAHPLADNAMRQETAIKAILFMCLVASGSGASRCVGTLDIVMKVVQIQANAEKYSLNPLID